MNLGRFRLVYSQYLNMFVPVSEATKSHGQKSSGKRIRSRHALTVALLSIAYSYDAISAPPVLAPNALPTNWVTTSGAGTTNTNAATATMTVNQFTKNMTAKVDTLNIGPAANLNINQLLGNTSSLLIRVNAAGGLSQIMGKITANGQVYLINPNGFLFGKGASVNVNSLIASTLNISDDLFNKGFLSLTDGSAAFSGDASGYIQVDLGATLTAASGGKIMMFAPNIENNGLISTPDGQTLLAAGQKVYLAASDNPNLRGLLVEVDNGGTTTNTNLGNIIAERGNITLAGIAVNQNGRAKATTSVTANGSIKIQAQDTTTTLLDPVKNVTTRFATKGGAVVLGENSITEVLLDATDKATVLDSATVNKSKVDISGQSIHLMNNAMIIAPSGNVNLFAGLNPHEPTVLDSNSSAVPNSSRIYFDSGSVIDVSGVGSGSTVADRAGETAAQVSVASNVVQAELRSTQLRDSPLQRDGILNTAKVYVDARATGVDGNVGTSVADVSGYTSAIQHGVKERLATGGAVKVQSEGDIVFAPTATINVSGGKVDYTGGTVTKTRLVASNNQTYDIANASKDLKYVDIQNVSYQEQGYTSGKDAGSVSFSAPAMVLEGKLKGDTISGIHQRTSLTKPKGATLQIGQNKANAADTELLKQTYVLHSDLMLDASHVASSLPAFGDDLSKEQQQTLMLGSNFTAPTGFNSLLYYADGQITVKNGTNLSVTPSGNVTLNGGGVDVQGNITAHSGTIDLSAKNREGYIGKQATFTNNADSNVVVGSATTLDVSGLWTNDRVNPAVKDTVAVDGGKINISASSETGAGDITLAKGSVVNASGGAWLDASGKLSNGKGGDIKLLASDGITDDKTTSHTGKLKLDGTLRADSLATGGSLSLSSGTVTIGGAALGTTGETLIDPTLFQNGGFTSYDINGFEGLTLADNTTIAPAALTRVLDSGFSIQQSGADITKFSHLSMLPASNAALTRKVTSLSLSASNQNSGKLSLGLGSIISTDPGASVNLLAKRQLTILGSILAPAGNISATLGTIGNSVGIVKEDSVDALKYKADQTLWLGANSVLDVSGVTNSYNNNGFNVGTVKDAGNIALKATKGEVVAESGSQLKLNGTHAVLDVKSGNSYVAKDVASKGGNLSISAREGIMLDATMSAHGGNESVAAGNLSIALPLIADLQGLISSNDSLSPEEQYPTGPREIVLKATGAAVPVGLNAGDAIDASNNGLAYVFADKLQSAGFDTIQLAKSDKIRIADSLILKTRGAITLDTPNLVVNDGVDAVINSSYVGIGNGQVLTQNSLNQHLTPAVTGTGTLTVNADYIDLFGQQNLSGIGNKDTSTGQGGANFNSTGDIQLRGVLKDIADDDATVPVTTPLGKLQTAGDITLKAARIYPSTLSNYTLSSTGAGSTIAFKSSRADTGVPYSVLGTLNVEATNITQDGVLRAPFGVINLKASDKLTLGSDSLTSVSAEGKTLPVGYTVNGKDWSFDEGNGRVATISTLPDKKVNLDGKFIETKAGSKVDISGGGDLSAWEFTTGTGGSDDVLAASGVFAVMPELKAGYMAGNSESYSNGTFKAGDSIYLSGGNGLPAGNYVLLPAHYALLPGAYSVKAVAGTQDFTARQNTRNKDGSMIVSGYRTQFGGITADSRTSGFIVASGAIARTQSEFSNTLASNYFNPANSKGQASGLRLPADAGRVAISAVSNLILDGSIIGKHSAESRGSEVDISSDKIAISGDGSQEAGYLTLSSTKLNAMGAESLVIGGIRTGNAAGTQLDVTASNVKLIGGASLTGQEISLAATDTVSMVSGTSINATGAAVKNGSALIIGDVDTGVSGDGALLRVSTGEQRDLVRKNVSQLTGSLDIQSGAKVSATGSAIVDATNANIVSGDITLAKDAAIRLGAPKISFGTPTTAVDGLLLDNSKLAALGTPSNIQLKSYSTIDFYGTTAVGNDKLKSLTLETAGFKGYNNASDTVTLTAGTVKFANPDAATFDQSGTLGSGTLQVNAGKEVTLGNGTFSTAGFGNVNLKADQVIGEAKGTLDVTGDLNINAGRITAAGLSDQTIKASGNLVTSKHDVTTALDKAPLGGKLMLTADTITHGGIIDMPSGTVTLKAEGSAGGDSLVLLSGSQINANGSAKMLGTVAGLADAGTINLQTTKGNIRMDTGAVLDVSATGGAGAGKIAVNTAGIAVLAGTLNGLAAVGNGVGLPKQGSFELTATRVTDFKVLNTELERGNFNESRNIHVAQGDLKIDAGDTVTAHNVTLTTDDGDVNIDGTINASGSKGGIVKLNAGQLTGDGKGNITLASTAVINASATTAASESAGSTGDGGKVTLNTATDSDTSPSIGSRIFAAIGSVINVSKGLDKDGKGIGSDGKVVLRAPRLAIADNTQAGDSIAITKFGSTVKGESASIVAEGVKVYKNAIGEADITVDSTFIANMIDGNANFLTNSDGIKSTLGLASDTRFKVASGDEVRSAGDITVTDDLDLHDGGSGALTLRAKGNIKVEGSISAGFTTATSAGALTTGGAWDYRIAAGADLNSADVLATNNQGTGDFTLAEGKLIRTGTGDIEIATGGDFTLSTATSAIYTAGELDNTADYIASLGTFIPPTIAATYSKNGGDITLTSKGNINGADTVIAQLPADWLFRQGRVDATTGHYTKNTSWWVYFNNFKENIGALGGGDVSINAVGAINDLSAVIATNGRVFGTGPADGKLVQNGGGDLTVKAGGDISGGLYMVDKGIASIRAGGGLLADSNGVNAAFALGDAALNVATIGQLNLMTVFNPTLTGMSRINVPNSAAVNNNSSTFSTYGESSAVQLTSIASGVEITNQLAANDLVAKDVQNSSLHLLPGTLKVAALGGDFTTSKSSFTLMPSAKGSLELAASGSVNLDQSINMSDKNPADIPSILKPSSTQDFPSVLSTLLVAGIPNSKTYYTPIPLHSSDIEPIVIYAGNNIEGGSGSFKLYLPKKANIYAVNDINNLSVFGQNLSATDVTSISAGHDYNVGISGVRWGGPGYLDISAGRNVILGTSDGIITRGNLDNPFLPEAGANLSILVGAAAADDKAFIAKYLDPSASTIYNNDLISFVKKVTGMNADAKLSSTDAWAKFQAMDAQLQHQFAQNSFFNELKQAGIDHNDSTSKGFGSYQRGFDAIATYLPNEKYDGKLDLAFSQLKTERGGDLNVMAPGGSIVIGLPKIPEALLAAKALNGQNPSARLGIFTVKGGNINLFSKGNIDVAQSREFTIAGGDILDWSSEGDIDAGKGSKTATSAPPPLIRTDKDGNTFVDLSGVVSGSGIGTLQTVATAAVGNVYLIAPSGAVNAGDAGIRSSGNLVLAAQRVIGADNISVGGTSSGVPAVSSAGISFNAPASADSLSTNKQGDQLGAADKLGQNSKLAALPSVISVEVISLGDESTPAVKTEASTKPEASNKKDKDRQNKKD